jgi:hypothetical protein
MGIKPRQKPASGRRFGAAVATLAAAVALSAPGGASAGAGNLHYYHGTASNGQYLNLTAGPDSALVSFTRLWERCRPGFIHLLVNPVVLLNHASLGGDGSFSKTLHVGTESTSYKGVVKANSARVRVQDTGNKICEGTDITFKLNLIR